MKIIYYMQFFLIKINCLKLKMYVQEKKKDMSVMKRKKKFKNMENEKKKKKDLKTE